MFDTFYWYEDNTRVEVQFTLSHCWDGNWQLWLGNEDQIIPPDLGWFPEERIDQSGVLRYSSFRAPQEWQPRNGTLFFSDADGSHKVEFRRLRTSIIERTLIYTLTDGSWLKRPYEIGPRKAYKGMCDERLIKLMAGRKRDHMRLWAELTQAKILTWEADISPIFHVLERDYYKGLRRDAWMDDETHELDFSRGKSYIYVDAMLKNDKVYVAERCSDGEYNERVAAAPFILYIESGEDEPTKDGAAKADGEISTARAQTEGPAAPDTEKT